MNPREGGPVGFSEASERADERPGLSSRPATVRRSFFLVEPVELEPSGPDPQRLELPETPLTPEQRARFEAAAERGLAARRRQIEEDRERFFRDVAEWIRQRDR